MDNIRKAHCLFEQSGSFKNEFISLGIPAEDYDIQNNFGQTDHVIDLFSEIENCWGGQKSLFDNILQDDIIMAFFPCIYFESMSQMYFDGTHLNLRSLDKKGKYEVILERADKRHKFYSLLYKLYAICDYKGLRLVIENPSTAPNYLIGTQNFPKPTIIDKDRSNRGDNFKKPTAYWFVNCEPTQGFSYSKNNDVKTIMKSKSAPVAGLCSEERSMISPVYAHNFICDFILGQPSKHNTQPSLFD